MEKKKGGEDESSKDGSGSEDSENEQRSSNTTNRPIVNPLVDKELGSDISKISILENRQSSGCDTLNASSQSLTFKERELGIEMEETAYDPETVKDWLIADSHNLERKGNTYIIKGNCKTLTIPERLLEVKELGGRFWVAALPEAKACPHFMEVLGTFIRPSKGDKFVERESRERIWRSIMCFLNAKGSFKEAGPRTQMLGASWWQNCLPTLGMQ